ALEALLTLPEVDPARLGTVGHSLGAMEAMYLAAFDDRIKCCVAHECAIKIAKDNWDASWFLGPECVSPAFERGHHELIALIAPRPFLLIAGDASDNDTSGAYLDAARPVYELFAQPAPLGFFNHRQGHVVIPEAQRKIEQWLLNYT